MYPPPRPIRLIVVIVSIMASVHTIHASSDARMWKALSMQQKEMLSDGKPIIVEESIPDNAWPRYIVYRLVGCSPAKIAALFWDCEQAPKYVPNCLSVHLISSPRPWIHVARYSLKMPMMLPEEVYVSRNELTNPEPDVYEISWKVCEARYIKGSAGNLRIEPIGAKTLVRYTNLVMPGSSIAGLLQSEARHQVVQSVDALANQVEQEICMMPELIAHQIERLHESLEK